MSFGKHDHKPTREPPKAAPPKPKGLVDAEVQRLAGLAMRAWEGEAIGGTADAADGWWLFVPVLDQGARLEINRFVQVAEAKDVVGAVIPGGPEPDAGKVWVRHTGVMGQAAFGATDTAMTELASIILAVSAPP